MSITIVGDTDQTLYRFQGAKPELLTSDINQWLPDIQTIKLEINYRSTDEIIARSQQLISHNYSNLGGPYPQQFMKNASGIKNSGEPIQFQMYDNAEHEALEIANNISKLIQDGYSAGNIFIGARTNAQLGFIESALVKTQLPFINTRGGSFWQSKHIADVIGYLRVAYNGDKDAFARINNIASNDMVYAYDQNKKEPHKGKFQIGDYCSTRFLGVKFLQAIDHDTDKINNVYRAGKHGWRNQPSNSIKQKKVTDGQKDLKTFVDDLKWSIKSSPHVGMAIQFIINNCYEKYLKNQGMGDDGLSNAKLEDLATVQEIASKYASIDKFLAYVDEAIKTAEDAKNKNWEDYIVISTIHKLKGLERKIVFGIGWCEGVCEKTDRDVGLLPQTFSLSEPPNFGVLPGGSMSPIEDERCCGFVLVSRAIERCYLSGISSYRTYNLVPSRFIYEMGLLDKKENNDDFSMGIKRKNIT